MRREWKSSVKSKRAVTNLRLYQHQLRVDLYKLHASTSLYIYNYTMLNVIIWNRLFLVSPVLHIILSFCHLLRHHLLLFLLLLLLLLLLTTDLIVLVSFSFLSIKLAPIIRVHSSAVLLQSSAVVESVYAQASSCVFAQLNSVSFQTGLRQRCVPFKSASTRRHC